MQKKYMLILIVCLAVVGLRTSATAQTARASFKTPEEAITLFMQGITQSDVSQILQACAIEEIGKNFKFDLYTNRIEALSPFESPAPSEYPFYAEMNKVQLSERILGQVKIFAFSLLSTEKVAEGNVIIIDADRTTQFIKDVDPTRLAKLAVKTIVPPKKTLMESTRYVENAAKLAHVYGADDYTERLALFQFEGNYYFVGFSLLHYGDTWKIINAVSRVANTSSLGAAQKTTEKDFEAMVN